MEKQNGNRLLFRIRVLITVFIVFLVLSGLTAFPIETQLSFFVKHISLLPELLRPWIKEVSLAVSNTNESYPFLSYGTDWLAFAHLVIAVAFIGPLKDPVRNVWVIQFGIIACIVVLPLALIAGTIREIPTFWILIDCSFGVFGIFPLYLCYKGIKKLERLSVF